MESEEWLNRMFDGTGKGVSPKGRETLQFLEKTICFLPIRCGLTKILEMEVKGLHNKYPGEQGHHIETDHQVLWTDS